MLRSRLAERTILPLDNLSPQSNMSDVQRFASTLQGKRVLILGGSLRIGLVIARGCIECGEHVIVTSSRQSRITAAADSILEY
jgi:FlaA1/EpsC-like NDP-sugar epimerase